MATNTLITDAQFERLKEALGKKVTMWFHVWELLSDEDETYEEAKVESFRLHGFNYVIDPKTGLKYLAFLRYGDGNKFYFPYFQRSNIFQDTRFVRIERVEDPTTGVLIRLFDRSGNIINFKWNSVDQDVRKIEEFSIGRVKPSR